MAVEIVINKGSVVSPDLQKFTAMNVERYRESFKREYGFDPNDVIQHFNAPGFSLREVQASIKKQVLREAVSEQMFGGLIRAGVAKVGVDWYALVPTIYKDIAYINPSDKFEEWYNPVHRGDIPVALQPGEPAPEGKIAGFQVNIRNLRYARAMTIERELIDDDQTNTIIQRAQAMGEGMAYAEELASIIALFAASASAPASNVAGNTTAIATSAGQLTQPNLENAWTALTYVTDLEGNFMLVRPNALVVNTSDELTAEKLMQSMFQPAAPAGTAGSIGYFQTKNVLEGKFSIHATAFVNKARAGINATYAPWALMEKAKSLVFQPRTPLSVEQEAPNSGASLMQYQYRYVAQRRFGVNVVEPRFTFWGN